MASMLVPAPEIDPKNGVAAVALVVVAAVILRGRRKKKESTEGTKGICA
jgi:hypothetical protein